MLAALADDVDGDDELAVSAIEGETGLVEAIDRALARLDEIEALRAAIESRRERLAARSDRLGAALDRIRQSLRQAMSTTGLRRLERPVATLGLRRAPPRLLIEPGAIKSLPIDCLRYPPAEANKALIRARLEEGNTIIGCSLQPSEDQLIIRTA